MKNRLLRLSFSLLVAATFPGCGPTIHYLGDTHSPTSTVDLYYDAKEVKQDYTVIGRMTNDQFVDYGVEVVKEEMIKKAKQVGANAIIFSDLGVENTRAEGDRLSVKAQLIKYK